MQQFEDIRAFVKGTVADKSPIVPISAQLRYNIDVVAEYITNSIPVPMRDFTGAGAPEPPHPARTVARARFCARRCCHGNRRACPLDTPPCPHLTRT